MLLIDDHYRFYLEQLAIFHANNATHLDGDARRSFEMLAATYRGIIEALDAHTIDEVDIKEVTLNAKNA